MEKTKKQPTHADLMREIEGLKKRVEKLEPKDELAPFRDLLDEIRKVMPQREIVPVPYPYPYPTYPWYPYPQYPWYTYASTADATSNLPEGSYLT